MTTARVPYTEFSQGVTQKPLDPGCFSSALRNQLPGFGKEALKAMALLAEEGAASSSSAASMAEAAK